MAKGYDRGDSNVRCPYYVGCFEKAILCEGGIDPRGKTETRFHSKECKREYMNKYCRSCFYECSMCRRNDEENKFIRPNCG